MIIPDVLFDDETLLVVCKPAGMVVNRADTVEAGETLQDWVETYLTFHTMKQDGTDAQWKTFTDRSGIAHRLDKETSGVMVIAKTATALDDVLRQFRERQTEKEYIALVHGVLEPKEGDIKLPLGRSPYNRHKFRVD